MYVLVACEESQTVCKAFRELGHIAFSCDIQRCSGGSKKRSKTFKGIANAMSIQWGGLL